MTIMVHNEGESTAGLPVGNGRKAGRFLNNSKDRLMA